MQINSFLSKSLAVVIIPSTAQDIDKSSLPISRGNWLYVGGNGLGNYSKIQDAIDNATDGDTVFVYDDSSPYNENLNFYKSITIQGENMTTTIIDGGGSISSDYVIITNFTFTKHGPALSIEGFSNNIIENCVFYEIAAAIYLQNSNNNTIRNCNFSHSYTHHFLLVIGGSNNNEISYSNFFDNGGAWGEPAIVVHHSRGTNIQHCNITRNYACGVDIFFSDILLTSNNIFNNDGPGLELGFLSFCDLRHNWWGTPNGPSITFKLLFREQVSIRKVYNGDTVYFYEKTLIGSLIGLTRFLPWLSEPVPDAGQHV
jgi:parallel beta-helix repeat protein